MFPEEIEGVDALLALKLCQVNNEKRVVEQRLQVRDRMGADLVPISARHSLHECIVMLTNGW